ncbi:MAG: EpsI family protein, partial [Alphaproteobacteria bacterium]|nr:EpsI family protein [Alphaproteobacteria bacterium]
VAFSVLVANVCFISWPRRILFVATAIGLAILANGLRAWGTIYIAHLTTPEFARGVDHVVYGWVFFAIVLVLVMAVGWRFFDRPADDPFIDPATLQPVPPAPATPRALAAATAVVVGLAAAAPGYALWMDSYTVAQPTERLVLAAPPGWRPAPFAGLPWEPHYEGASATRIASFVDGEGQTVDLYVAVYDRQSEGHELIRYANGIIKPLNEDIAGWGWAGNAAPVAGAATAQINYSGAVRDAWQWYLVNGRIVASPYQAKIEGLKAKLFNGPPLAATVVISAERRDPLVSTAPALERFRRAAGAPDAIVARALADGRR